MNKDLKTALITGGVVLVVLVGLSLFWRGSGWNGMGPGMMGDWGGGWWWMAIPMIVVPILGIWAIVAFVRGVSTTSGQSASGNGESALEILKKRYARGDISKQEFEEKRRDLE